MRFRQPWVKSTGEIFLSRMSREASLRLSQVASDAGAWTGWLSIGLALPMPLINVTAVAERLLTNVLREQTDSSFSFMRGIIRQVLWVRDLSTQLPETAGCVIMRGSRT